MADPSYSLVYFSLTYTFALNTIFI